MPTAVASWTRSRHISRTPSEPHAPERGWRGEGAACRGRPSLPSPRGPPIRRHVLYVPGFDPRDAHAYWGLFRRESALTAARRRLDIRVGAPAQSPDALTWTLACESAGSRADVVYTVLRWDDVVRRQFPRANGVRLLAAPLLWWRLWRCGHVAALRRVGRRFATVILTVHLIFAGLVALAGLATLAVFALIEHEHWPPVVVSVLAAALALGLLALAMATTRGRPFYVAHLVDDTAFTHRHAAGRVPALDARLLAFADRIAAAADEAEEVVVVGHSSGSFLGAEALACALDRNPELGTRGARVVFLTLGNVTPWITLDPAARRQREALARIARAPVAWIDVLATWDWLSVHARDPLAAAGLPPCPGRVTTLQVALGSLVDPETRRRTRFNLFRRHFLLLMAARNPRSFDYLALVASPAPVEAFVAACRPVEEAALTGGRL